MVKLVITCVLLGAAPDAAPMQATLRTLSGESVTGTLESLSAQQMGVRVGNDERKFALSDLQAVVFSELDEPDPDSEDVWVQFVDGSLVRAVDYSVTGREARIVVGKQELTVPTRKIKSVRFRQPSETLNKQWQELSSARLSGDIVVVRRSETALDQLDGVLQDVAGDIVQFQFDDELIHVNRQKLEGIVYLHSGNAPQGKLMCTVYERNGSRWAARSAQLSAGVLHVETDAGIAADVDLGRVASLEFASSNVVYLSDLEPESVEWTPYVASKMAREHLAQLYRPRRDRSFAGPELLLNKDGSTQSYSKGLGIHSRTLMTYRLAGEYQKFTAVVGIDARLQGRGHVQLRISADGRPLLERVISGHDSPSMVDLDVSGVRRLRILVDFGQSADIADHLNLCDARLTK